MDKSQATLLLTRPEPQSRAFLAECEARAGRRIPAVISPVLEIAAKGTLPDFTRFATLVFTSGNGVRAAEHALKGRAVATVGAHTADLARQAGAEAVALGETAEAFLADASRLTAPVLICRGVHARIDLAERLAGMGLEVEEAVIYDQVARPPTPEAAALLRGSAPVVVPVFSPRSAELLSANVITAPLVVIAMSEAVAGKWRGKAEIRVASAPTAAAMCTAVLASI